MAEGSAKKLSVPAYSTDPTHAWSILQVKQKVGILKAQSFSKKKPDNHTRFVCISGMWISTYYNYKDNCDRSTYMSLASKIKC